MRPSAPATMGFGPTGFSSGGRRRQADYVQIDARPGARSLRITPGCPHPDRSETVPGQDGTDSAAGDADAFLTKDRHDLVPASVVVERDDGAIFAFDNKVSSRVPGGDFQPMGTAEGLLTLGLHRLAVREDRNHAKEVHG